LGAHYSTAGSRIISLLLLGDYVQEITRHAAACGQEVQFLGKTAMKWLCSVLAAKYCEDFEDIYI